MTFLDDMRKLFNTPAIPDIPNSTVGDIFGLGSYFGFDNPFGGDDDDDDTTDKIKMIPYIIIGVGAVALIFVLKK